MRRPRLLLLALPLAAVLRVGPAHASDPERAARLFGEGRDAMATQDYALACGKFIESERDDPRVGTLINLAQCEEALAKIATSRAYWQQALDLAHATSDSRSDYIEAQLSLIDARVPRLTVRLAATAPPDTVVRRDGVEFESASFGVPLPVETGSHTLLVLAPRRDAKETKLDVGEGERLEIVVEPGAPLVEPSGSPSAASLKPMATAPEPGPLRTLAHVAGGAGLVGVGVGVVYGVLAANAAGAAAPHCNGDLCDPTGTAARNDEIAKAQVATISLVAGVALLGGGAVLRVLTPSPDEVPYVRRNLAYVAGATGLAALATGAVFGLRAIVDHRDASSGCHGTACDPQGAAAQHDEAGTTTISVVALAGGGLLLGTAAILLATAPTHPAAKSQGGIRLVPAAGSRGGCLMLLGAW